MKIAYTKWNPKGEAAAIVAQANVILESYTAQGYEISLRQLYYQFVSRDIIPNTEKSYKRLGQIIGKARDAGLVDWDHIDDRGRNLYGHTTYDSGEDFLEAMADKYYADLWEGQPCRVQVWVEKDALSGVVARAASKWDVDYFPCKGYMSASAIWAMGRMMVRTPNVKWFVLHLGDHDPSGIDMTRDVRDRLELYTSPLVGRGEKRPYLDVNRIALNMDQIEQYDPPPNPAKITDSRAASYIQKYGDESWELDALEPDVIVALIEKQIRKHIVDMAMFEERRAYQAETRAQLRAVRIEL